MRDVIRRGGGKLELLEKVAEANGLSWHWIKTGEGEMDVPEATPAPRRGVKHYAWPPYYPEQLELKREPSSEPAAEELPVNILVNRAALLHALRLFGASEEQAARAVEFLSALASMDTKNLPLILIFCSLG